MFQLLIESKLPGPANYKPLKDICKAAKSSFPTQVPISQNPKLPGFQSFLDSYKENAINTTKAYQILEKILNTICDKDENRPAVMSIFHALTTLNINVQTHMMAFQQHLKSKTALSIPAR